MAILGALGGGLLVSVLIFLFSTEETPPRFYEALAFLGFLVAMTWIFVVANEVVGILQAYGMILGVSDAILGLTVFAMVTLRWPCFRYANTRQSETRVHDLSFSLSLSLSLFIG